MENTEGLIYIVAFSGGKDSVAMVLKLLQSGVNKNQIHLHHHDVDGGSKNVWDWGGTTSYCEAFAAALGIKLFFSFRQGGIDAEMMRDNRGLQNVYYQDEMGSEYVILESRPGNTTRLKFPAVTASLMTRWCSSCVKIDVLRRVISAMYKEGSYVVCTGERKEESANRAKYNEYEPHPCNTSKRNVIAWRPILDWTEVMVWDIMRDWKIQPHPCYMLGYSRCSCQICIFGSGNVWASNFELSPEKVEYVHQRELQFEFTLYSKMNIYDKVKTGKSFLIKENVERWKNEAILEFVSPIFVNEWVLPQGAMSKELAGAA